MIPNAGINFFYPGLDLKEKIPVIKRACRNWYMAPFALYLVALTIMYYYEPIIGETSVEKLERNVRQFGIAYFGVFLYLLLLVCLPRATIYGTLFLNIGVLMALELYILWGDAKNFDDFLNNIEQLEQRVIQIQSIIVLVASLVVLYLFFS